MLFPSKTFTILARLLRGEVSAVEVYDFVLITISDKQSDMVQICREDHVRRVGLLTMHILHLGAEPNIDVGTWIDSTALVCANDQQAIHILEQIEAHESEEYRHLLLRIDRDFTEERWIREVLYPAQVDTEQTMHRMVLRAA